MPNQAIGISIETKSHYSPLLRQNPSHSTGTKQDQNRNGDDLYRVRIIDNSVNTYQEVMEICMEALGVSMIEAYHIALAVDHNGYAEVLEAPFPQAEKVAKVIRRIGIQVDLIPSRGSRSS